MAETYDVALFFIFFFIFFLRLGMREHLLPKFFICPIVASGRVPTAKRDHRSAFRATPMAPQ